MNRFELFIVWLGDFVEDSRTGRPSVKRFGLALAVTVLCVIMGAMGGVSAGISWQLKDTDKAIELVKEMLSTLQIVAGLTLTAVTTGYLVDKNQIRKNGKADDDDESGN